MRRDFLDAITALDHNIIFKKKLHLHISWVNRNKKKLFPDIYEP